MKILIIFCIVLLAFGASILVAAIATVPKGDMKIKKSGTVKTSVVFNHEKHASIKSAKDCEGCHSVIKSMKDAHDSCMGCHLSDGKGPVKCDECHKTE